MIADIRQRATEWVDWLIVLALAGLALRDIWNSPFTGLRPVNTFLFLSVCLTLLWRRRAPLVVLLIAVAVLGIQANFFDPLSQPPFSSFVILLVAFYSLAVYGGERRAILGGAAAFAAEVLLIDLPRFLAGESPGNIIPAWVFIGAFWLAGRTIRQRRLQAERLQDLAAQIDREREENARSAVAEERSRISRELHDVVAHSVSVMVVQAQAAQRLLEAEPKEALQALSSIEATGRQALVEMRRMLGILRRNDEELTLAPQPGLKHLDVLIEQTRKVG